MEPAFAGQCHVSCIAPLALWRLRAKACVPGFRCEDFSVVTRRDRGSLAPDDSNLSKNNFARGCTAVHVIACMQRRTSKPALRKPVRGFAVRTVLCTDRNEKTMNATREFVRGIFRLWLGPAEGVWPSAPYDRSRNNATAKRTRTRTCPEIISPEVARSCMQLHATAYNHVRRYRNMCEVLPSAQRCGHGPKMKKKHQPTVVAESRQKLFRDDWPRLREHGVRCSVTDTATLPELKRLVENQNYTISTPFSAPLKHELTNYQPLTTSASSPRCNSQLEGRLREPNWGQAPPGCPKLYRFFTSFRRGQAPRSPIACRLHSARAEALSTVVSTFTGPLPILEGRTRRAGSSSVIRHLVTLKS
jgi:hypothetical protein